MVCIERRKQEHKSNTPVELDNNFCHFARKQLKCIGKGNRLNSAESLSDKDIEKMWDKCTLCDDCPNTEQSTIWFLICIYYYKGSSKKFF